MLKKINEKKKKKKKKLSFLVAKISMFSLLFSTLSLNVYRFVDARNFRFALAYMLQFMRLYDFVLGALR